MLCYVNFKQEKDDKRIIITLGIKVGGTPLYFPKYLYSVFEYGKTPFYFLSIFVIDILLHKKRKTQAATCVLQDIISIHQ